MFVRIDHVMICVPDLDAGIAQYRKLGFDMHPGGVHPGKGTHWSASSPPGAASVT